MRYRKKLVILLLLALILALLQIAMPNSPSWVRFYSSFIFKPFQSFRNILFGYIPVSVGDLLYAAASVLVVATAVKWGYFLARFSKMKHSFAHSLLRSVTVLCIAYMLFFIGWGGNYYRPALAEHWKLDLQGAANDSVLFAFDSLLVDRLNRLAPHYTPLSFKETDKRTQQYYKKYTDYRSKLSGLNAKASIFGNILQYLSIQGYYNPFTGEAQVNKFQPAFMLPFVVCHEIAHQSGIASEEDANLMAFAVGSSVPDTSFVYSAYFNIWLYTHSRVHRVDSIRARQIRTRLNGITRGHMDTLKAIRKKYRSGLSDYSAYFYDGYLKLHHQKDGIHSYNNVVWSAWELERKRSRGLIRIP